MSDDSKEELELILPELTNDWITSGIDLEKRRIEVNQDVDSIMASKIIRAMSKMVDISNAPIEILLATGGGDIDEGLAIYDAISTCPAPVKIKAIGEIMSSGLIIFLAANDRSASKHTRFMFHHLSFKPNEEHTKSLEIQIIESKVVYNMCLDILAERTLKNKKFWYSKTISHNYYFGIEEAKEMGVVTVKKGKNVKQKTK